MALALRPLLSESSMKSRKGSQALALGLRPGAGTRRESGDTALAGFGLPAGPAAVGASLNSAPKSVDTSLAGFAGGRRPHDPGGRTATPAAFRYVPAVSRRTPVACSMRRSGQPSRPSAITCCRFSSLKTLLTMTEGTLRHSQCPDLNLVGRFSAVPHWPVLGVPRGRSRARNAWRGRYGARGGRRRQKL